MTPYPLHKSDRNTKILITLFLATMLVSIAVAELNVYDKVRWTRDGIVRRYGADEAPPAEPIAPPPAATGAEDFPLESGSNGAETPAEPEVGPTATGPVARPDELVAKMNTFSLLVDVTHPHVFELPVVLFVLAHFLMRTRAADWFKLANYVVAFGGMAAFLATPWIVRYASERAAPLLLVGAVAIGTTSLLMIAVSIVDMWSPARRKPKPSPAVA